MTSTGVVVIGRNEGSRLERCLNSILSTLGHVVYVDSGSSDGSVQMSRALGIEVVELDPDRPFTAARARNEGLRKLLKMVPHLRYVFFVDGDCEVVSDWLTDAVDFMEDNPQFAVVFGRRRERYPERSVYNLLCDFEWGSSPPGEAYACGGDAIMRVEALRQINGFRADLICGEEPELCVRLRKCGWRIWRLDRDMTIHDAAMYHFWQWWRRMMRAGYAYAQGVSLHGAPPERHWVRESRSAWIWGLGIPLATLMVSTAFGLYGLSLLVLYPLQALRLAVRGNRRPKGNIWYACALVVCKFPEMLGQAKFHIDRARRIQSGLIEYK